MYCNSPHVSIRIEMSKSMHGTAVKEWGITRGMRTLGVLFPSWNWIGTRGRCKLTTCAIPRREEGKDLGGFDNCGARGSGRHGHGHRHTSTSSRHLCRFSCRRRERIGMPSLRIRIYIESSLTMWQAVAVAG